MQREYVGEMEGGALASGVGHPEQEIHLICLYYENKSHRMDQVAEVRPLTALKQIICMLLPLVKLSRGGKMVELKEF